MYLIALVKDSKVLNVWAHHGVDGGQSGCWAYDYDAAYTQWQFGYGSKAIAGRRARKLQKLQAEVGNNVVVMPRAALFEELGVEDWAKGR